jgi:hypothetical protein
MLPVSEAEALNIVVFSPCWKYGWTDMLSFKYLSMAFLEIRKTWTGCLFDSFGEESFLKRILLCISFYFVMVDCIFCARMP